MSTRCAATSHFYIYIPVEKLTCHNSVTVPDRHSGVYELTSFMTHSHLRLPAGAKVFKQHLFFDHIR